MATSKSTPVPQQDVIQMAVSEAKNILADKKNKSALAVAGAVYFLSKDNKERNAIIAGVATLLFLPEDQQPVADDDEEDDGDE